MKLINIKNLTLTDHVLKMRFGNKLKTTCLRPSFQQEGISLKASAPDSRLCVTTVIKDIWQNLFVSVQTPQKAVS